MNEYMMNCLTRVTVAVRDWERKERERHEEDAEKLECQKIEAFRLEKLDKLENKSSNLQEEFTTPANQQDDIVKDDQSNWHADPHGEDMVARHPFKKPNRRVSQDHFRPIVTIANPPEDHINHPNQTNNKNKPDDDDGQPSQLVEPHGGSMGARQRHPKKQPN
jgi:hypothetical protein